MIAKADMDTRSNVGSDILADENNDQSNTLLLRQGL